MHMTAFSLYRDLNGHPFSTGKNRYLEFAKVMGTIQTWTGMKFVCCLFQETWVPSLYLFITWATLSSLSTFFQIDAAVNNTTENSGCQCGEEKKEWLLIGIIFLTGVMKKFWN